MSERDRVHKEYTKEKESQRKEELFLLFKIKRNLIISLIRKSKCDYYTSYFEENRTDSKKTWEGIRNIVNISKKTKVVPIQLKYKNEIKCDNKDMAESFNDFFVNIGNMVEDKIPKGTKNFRTYLKNKNLDNLLLSPVDSIEVDSMISSSKSNKACGPNSIPSKILKSYKNYLIEPITHLINLSFSQGNFPSLLKLANVCPIFKKNDKSLCENYRPISLLSNLSKLFERAMHNRIYKFLEISDVLYDLQFGFRKRYSTNHALLSIVEGVREQLDNKTFACGVFIDLEKAFDTVNHKILLQKLDHYGIRGITNKWFSSYLSNRKQKVSLAGISSEYREISCGVPQGSILGPLLFLIYINDMNKAVKYSLTHHFADDTNLLCSDKDPKVLQRKMNEDLRLIFQWLCANRLSLNVSKTEFIVFKPPRKSLPERFTLKLNGKTLMESSKIKYLGVVMDDRLTWKHHFLELRKKLNKSIGIIFKMRQLCPQKVLLSLYYSLVYSHLSYGICLWGNADETHLEQIRLAQKKVVRIITNSDYSASTTELFAKLKILKLDDIYLHQYGCLMWDQDHGILPKCFESYFKETRKIHDHKTRMADDNKLSENVKINTITYGKKMFKFQGPKVLNGLKNLTFYRQSKTKFYFRRKYKFHIVSQYE